MTLFLLLLAALGGGAANALAGGGTFLVFPALLWAGVASVKANATASLVLMPGGVASAWVFRKSLRTHAPRLMWQLNGMSVAGAIVGSLLLLMTTNERFSSFVPWLLLIATVAFTGAPPLREMAARKAGHGPLGFLLAGQFLIAIYGGYFGAGMGILMIAMYLAVAGMDIHIASGMRLLCTSAINVLAVIIFAWRGALDWKLGLPMLVAGIAGGYLGAHVVRRLNAAAVRNSILVFAWVLTVWFFVRPFVQ